jgi:hypothetical protein
MAASTVYAVLRRYRLSRLANLDRTTGQAGPALAFWPIF